jgi:hypothetical protein
MAFSSANNNQKLVRIQKWKPKRSVRETFIPGVWKSTKFFTSRDNIVAGCKLSQDAIENDILRKKFKDPRIHFAIICASLGAPPLPRFAYTGENVQAKLDEQTRKYINSPQGTRIDRPENTLYLYKLFDWYADDFKAKSGSVMNFIKPYLAPEALEFLKQNPKSNTFTITGL